MAGCNGFECWDGALSPRRTTCCVPPIVPAPSLPLTLQSAAKPAVMEPGEAEFFGAAWLEDNTP